MRATGNGSLGQQFIAAAEEAVQIERGTAQPARVTKYTAAETEVDPPRQYGSDRIKRIRAHMALSQPVFAGALNVSPETVKAWEQGKREPDGPTVRLLEIAEEHPEVLLARVRVVTLTYKLEPSEDSEPTPPTDSPVPSGES